MTTVAIRNYRDHDLLALTELINAADRIDQAGFGTTVRALRYELAAPDARATDNVFLAECHGHLIGYVRLHLRHYDAYDCVSTMGIVHPGWRRQGIGTALMKRAEERARMLKGSRLLFLEMAARAPVSGADKLALSLGMQPIRYFFWMECHDLDHLPEPVFPHGIRLRTYVVGQDEAAFVAAYNEAFAGHWGFIPHTLEHEQHWQSMPGFRAEDTLLAEDQDGHIAGLCTLLFPQAKGLVPHGDVGVVDDLAVRPAYRQRGIGRALLLAGMQRIRQEGFSEAGLAVDTDNPTALKLYESLGFAVVSRTTVYRKEVV